MKILLLLRYIFFVGPSAGSGQVPTVFTIGALRITHKVVSSVNSQRIRVVWIPLASPSLQIVHSHEILAVKGCLRGSDLCLSLTSGDLVRKPHEGVRFEAVSYD